MKTPMAVFLTLCATSALADAFPDEPHIVVDGSALVSSVPDVLEMSLSISELDLDVAKAAATVEARSSRFLAVVKSLGIEPRDITSSELSITPKYNWNNREQVLVGTLVSRKIELELRDLSKYHDLIAVVIEARIGEIRRTTLKISGEEELRRTLLQQAVNDARRNAQLLVSGSDERVGSIYSLTSQRQGGVRRASFSAGMERDQGSFEPGSIEVRETVRAIFYLTK